MRATGSNRAVLKHPVARMVRSYGSGLCAVSIALRAAHRQRGAHRELA
jgi:hypothetical protein